MQGNTKYDVVIVGAGPAGAMLAYALASAGVQVLLIEKKNLPRYKPCGGGLTKRTLSVLPFDIEDVIEDYTYRVEVFVQNERAFVKTREDPVVGMVMRDRFDHFLVRKAVSAGATLQEGTTFRSLSGSTGDLSVKTSKGLFKSQLVVGADGVNSRVARALGLKVRRRIMCALEGEVFCSDSKTLMALKNAAHFDFGVVPRGYAWIFPKRDHLSIGVLTTSRTVEHLKPYFTSYLKMKGLEGSAEVRSLKVHSIPYRADKRNILSTEKGLLVGDATGFADPITGEGIYYAVRGAQIASAVLVKGLSQGHEAVEKYTDTLKDQFMPELANPQRLAHILYNYPNFSGRLLKKYGEKLGEYHVEVIRGENAYAGLHKSVLKLPSLGPALFSK